MFQRQLHSPAMEASPSAVKRRVVVCAKNGCLRCSVSVAEAPDDCPVRILHLLETREGGLRKQPRQSGKTTELVSVANDIAGAGYPVYYVTCNMQHAKRIQQAYGLDRNVVIASEMQAERHFRGMSPGFVIFDEIQPQKVERIMQMMIGSQMVAGRFTPAL